MIKNMFKIVLILAISVSCTSSGDCNNAPPGEVYNILTVDGGGIRGLIPARVIERMEYYAYEYVLEKGWLEKVPKALKKYKYKDREGSIHMSMFFDMFAGTSTGSILAAGLTKPKMQDGKSTCEP